MLSHRAKASPEKFASATYSRSTALIQRQFAKNLKAGSWTKDDGWAISTAFSNG